MNPKTETFEHQPLSKLERGWDEFRRAKIGTVLYVRGIDLLFLAGENEVYITEEEHNHLLKNYPLTDSVIIDPTKKNPYNVVPSKYYNLVKIFINNTSYGTFHIFYDSRYNQLYSFDFILALNEEENPNFESRIIDVPVTKEILEELVEGLNRYYLDILTYNDLAHDMELLENVLSYTKYINKLIKANDIVD